MKTYQQEGFNLVLKPMMESGNICQCCDKYEHEAEEVHELGVDDFECQVCGMLCACKCHRDAKSEEVPPTPPPKPKTKPKAKRKSAKKRPAK